MKQTSNNNIILDELCSMLSKLQVIEFRLNQLS